MVLGGFCRFKYFFPRTETDPYHIYCIAINSTNQTVILFHCIFPMPFLAII